MLLVAYDISDDKLRSQFSKFLEQHGHRVQYSIFQVENSDRIVNNIVSEIRKRFEKKFEQSDSVIMIPLSVPNEEKMMRFGYAKNEETDIIMV